MLKLKSSFSTLNKFNDILPYTNAFLSKKWQYLTSKSYTVQCTNNLESYLVGKIKMKGPITVAEFMKGKPDLAFL